MTTQEAIAIEEKAEKILSSYGYHDGDVVCYNIAKEIVMDLLTP